VRAGDRRTLERVYSWGGPGFHVVSKIVNDSLGKKWGGDSGMTVSVKQRKKEEAVGTLRRDNKQLGAWT